MLENQSLEHVEGEIEEEQSTSFVFPAVDTDGVYDSGRHFYDSQNMDKQMEYELLSNDQKITWMVLFCRTQTKDPVKKFTQQELTIYGPIKNAFQYMVDKN